MSSLSWAKEKHTAVTQMAMLDSRGRVPLGERYSDNLMDGNWTHRASKEVAQLFGTATVCSPRFHLLPLWDFKLWEAFPPPLAAQPSFTLFPFLLSTSQPGWGGSSAPDRLVFCNHSDNRENIRWCLVFCPWEVGKRWSYLFIFSRTKIIGSLKYWNWLFMEMHQGCTGLGFSRWSNGSPRKQLEAIFLSILCRNWSVPMQRPTKSSLTGR